MSDIGGTKDKVSRKKGNHASKEIGGRKKLRPEGLVKVGCLSSLGVEEISNPEFLRRNLSSTTLQGISENVIESMSMNL